MPSTKGVHMLQPPEKRRLPIVRVMVYDLSTEEGTMIRSRDINLLKSENQQWLRRLLFWATSNHYSVEILHLEDFQKERIGDIGLK